jgi:ectoine hydroxylase-related dioxygenase (phytanoyl-CoA dioxygenase family)
MFYYLRSWLSQLQITQTREHLSRYLDNTPKLIGDPSIYGTEIDLTSSNGLAELKELVQLECSRYYQNKFICNNYWVSISEINSTVVRHNHIDPGISPQVSAVLYIEAPVNCGQLHLEEFNQTLTVSSGDLVLFPASCYHSVSENTSTSSRVCVAFDLTALAY